MTHSLVQLIYMYQHIGFNEVPSSYLGIVSNLCSVMPCLIWIYSLYFAHAFVHISTIWTNLAEAVSLPWGGYALCLSSVYVFNLAGNEYGITNVSSHGRVNITVIPPSKLGQQTNTAASFSPVGSNNSSSHHRYMPAAGSAHHHGGSAHHHGGSYNTDSHTITTQNRTVKTSTDYNPPANMGGAGQLLQTSTPKSAAVTHNHHNPPAPTGDRYIYTLHFIIHYSLSMCTVIHLCTAVHVYSVYSTVLYVYMCTEVVSGSCA